MTKKIYNPLLRSGFQITDPNATDYNVPSREIEITDYDSVNGTATFDLSQAELFVINLSSDVEFHVTNPVDNKPFVIKLTNGSLVQPLFPDYDYVWIDGYGPEQYDGDWSYLQCEIRNGDEMYLKWLYKNTIDQDAIAEALYSYGVLIDNNFSSPIVNRIGNLELHKTLPVQSLMKGCLLADNGNVNYYLHPTDWTKKYDGVTDSVLDGSHGQVMVEIPTYYEKNTQLNQFQFEKRISLVPLAGYSVVPKQYVSAYKASLQRSTNKLASVINLTTDYRGGNNNAAYDALSNTFLGKPATSISLTNFRAYARNRAAGTRWNCMTYEMRKSLYWLFVIEYANLNSQAVVTAKDTVTGLMQGGLGDGFTTANGTEWVNFNGSCAACPCGASNSLANASGEVNFTVNDFGGASVNRTFKANRYRGIENPFGDIWEWTDGILVDVKTDADGGTSTLYTGNDPVNFTDSVLANYTNRGLIARTEGYVKSMMLGVGGDLLPLNVTGGGSTTYFCDYFYRNVTSNEIKGVIVGGDANDGANAGLVCAYTINAPSGAASTIGSRLCFV